METKFAAGNSGQLDAVLRVTRVTSTRDYARSPVLAKDVFTYEHDSSPFVEGVVNPATDVMSIGCT